jgi:hypothetical protein
MIILFFSFCIASPFQDPPSKVWFANGWNRTTKKEIEQEEEYGKGIPSLIIAHSHNKLSW